MGTIIKGLGESANCSTPLPSSLLLTFHKRPVSSGCLVTQAISTHFSTNSIQAVLGCSIAHHRHTKRECIWETG
uniref:Uncharacterized protein n=1 Tax=Anguilla anguilla TaxID=7936 RepID=A0A0E9X028_ANGAN